ncbi:MAG: hypothetical protein F6J87_20375 [Spirulina sp. SIO3F2]|nr:hypothetical protein [Spirulina sp. SIO3F2]
MRGPQDDAIYTPGGKLLQRQLQRLEASGFTEAAAAAIQAAGVSDTDRAELQARLNQMPAGSSTAEAAQMYLETAERLRAAHTGDNSTPQWRSLGPNQLTAPQIYRTRKLSGRVSAVIVDPRNANHVLLGTAGGGVWESFNRGNAGSWQPRTDFAESLSVGALAFDPSNSTTVYCGTGEGNTPYFTPLGVGILRSVDGGTTWRMLGQNGGAIQDFLNPQNPQRSFMGQGFYDLMVDPTNSQHLLAATTTGIYVSTDGGFNWIRRHLSTAWSLSIAVTNQYQRTTEILAGCRDGVWSSTDGGTNWIQVALPNSPNPNNFQRLAVDIAPSNSSVAYAFGAIGNNVHLWRRANNAWTSVDTSQSQMSTVQAWYNWFIAVAPDQETQIYCGDVTIHRGDFSSWTNRWTWTSLSSNAQPPVHTDQHAIAFEPGNANTLYVGNDGGLYRSFDRGITWQDCNDGLNTLEFEYIAQDPNSTQWIIGGTQDNGTLRSTDLNTYQMVVGSDGGDCGVNHSNPNIVFQTIQNASLSRSNNKGVVNSWTPIKQAPQNKQGLFYAPFETSATNGDTIALGTNILFVSRDNGSTWVELAYPTPGVASAMYIPNASHIYIGLTNGQVLHTEWNVNSWTALTLLATPRTGAWVSDLFVDPNNLLRIWATYHLPNVATFPGGRVYRSDDGGKNWLDHTPPDNVTKLPINAIAIDPENEDRVWIAADLGVYESRDGGATWSIFSNQLPHMMVGDLIFHAQGRLLRAGTRNRGIWEIAVGAAGGGGGGGASKPLPRDQWRFDASSSVSPPENVKDGIASFWASNWQYPQSPPHWLKVDLGDTYEITGFTYQFRLDNTPGRIQNYEFYVSNQFRDWSTDPVYWGQPVQTGMFQNIGTEQVIHLSAPQTGRYICLRATSVYDYRSGIAAIDELNVLGSSNSGGGGSGGAASPLDRTRWQITATASLPYYGPNALKDDNPNTFWFTQQNMSFAHFLNIDLGGTYRVSGLRYTPRQDFNLGRIRDYEIYVNTNSSASPHWQKVAEGNWPNTTEEQVVTFSGVEGSQVYLNIRSSHDGQFSAVAELQILGTSDSGGGGSAAAVLPRDRWSLSASSWDPNAVPNFAKDGTNNAWWSSPYARPQHWLMVDLGQVCNITGMRYLAPMGEGHIQGYTLLHRLQPYEGWAPNAPQGTFQNIATEETVHFPSAFTARYVLLLATSSYGTQQRAAVSEINFLGTVQ